MAYRNIFVANENRLSLKNNQLIVKGEDNEVLSFPTEDIRCVLIDNAYSTLTARLISKLTDDGVCLIVCNEKHTPSALLMPIGTYCRQSKRIALQFNQSKPKIKRIWQSIVTQKINNQAKCLKLLDNEHSQTIYAIGKTVQSGDTSNREGYAARMYFRALFGDDFTRDDENYINAGLNYGYAILRSFIAKTIVAYGFEPSIGIHHKSQLNAFNLADDIIEPFRPIVDYYVYTNCEGWCKTFGTAQKAELMLLLNSAVLVDGKRHSVANAIELMVQSIVNTFENDDIILKLPEIVKTDFFDYD